MLKSLVHIVIVAVVVGLGVALAMKLVKVDNPAVVGGVAGGAVAALVGSRKLRAKD